MSYLDTRDLDKELEELQERTACDECGGSNTGDDFEEGCQHVFSDPLDEDETARLAALIALRDEVSGDWHDGVTLIPEDDFEDYAREMAEDIGDIPESLKSYIDWSRWARDAQTDYTSVDFDGTEYWYRS